MCENTWNNIWFQVSSWLAVINREFRYPKIFRLKMEGTNSRMFVRSPKSSTIGFYSFNGKPPCQVQLFVVRKFETTSLRAFWNWASWWHFCKNTFRNSKPLKTLLLSKFISLFSFGFVYIMATFSSLAPSVIITWNSVTFLKSWREINIYKNKFNY